MCMGVILSKFFTHEKEDFPSNSLPLFAVSPTPYYSTGSRKVHWLNQASAVELLWPTSTNTLLVTVSNNTVIFVLLL